MAVTSRSLSKCLFSSAVWYSEKQYLVMAGMVLLEEIRNVGNVIAHEALGAFP